MHLNQFKFLIAVAQYGSISRAAQELYISQSTISLSLINLEEELGYTILNRSKRGVTLTPEGQEVLKRAHIINDAIESLKEISTSEEKIFGDVRIAGNSHLGMNVITEAMLQLKHQHEGIRVYAHRAYIKDVLKEVAQKELDIAFINFNSLEQLDIRNDCRRYQLEFHKIFSDQMVICTRKDHPLQQKDHVVLKDVASYERVTMAFRKEGYFTHLFHEQSPQPMVTINDTANLRKYVNRSDAVVIIPRVEILRGNREYADPLYELQVQDFSMETVGGWVHHGTHEMLPVEACVVQTLENVCEQYTDLSE